MPATETGVVQLKLNENTTIFVEVVEPDRIPAEVEENVGAAEKVAGDTATGFINALDNIKPLMAPMLSSLRSIDEKLEGVSIEFGLKLTGQLGAIIASASAEANFKITLQWKR
jgi:hypothetical protein